MEHLPLMNVHFPPSRESELHEEIKRRANSPWSPQAFDAFGRPPKEGHYYFHRNVVNGECSCTLCAWRDKPGSWIIGAIVPDEGQPTPIPIEQYKRILAEFDAGIAGPAAEAVQGISAIEISQYRLEDYFSPNAVELLRRFCVTSNQGDLGQHLSDQEKWIAFLICVYDDGSNYIGTPSGLA
jgi:hypothetical protein